MGDTGIGMVISGVMSDEAGGSTYSVTVTGVSLQGDQLARAAHGSPVKWTSFKGQPEHNRACHDWIFTGLGLSFEYRGQFFLYFWQLRGSYSTVGPENDREIWDGCWRQQAFWEPVIKATKRIGKNRITA